MADLNRLSGLFERAEQGDDITVGFFGGSITQGSLASGQTLCYAYLVYEWWKKTFPKSSFHYVNAGIGGTTSHFGASRVERDLLMYRPDFAVVDFSVNDEPDDFFMETYEGCLRRILFSDTAPAVILLNNIYYDSGKTAEEQHIRIGDHYGVPHVSIRDTIYRQMKAGEYDMEELTPDGLHPNDFGHSLVAGEIIKCLENALESYKAGSYISPGSDNAGPPVTANRFENAIRYTIENAKPVLDGFRADPREKKGHLDFFKNGWTGRKKGDRLSFKARGVSQIAVQYRKTINKPAPVAIAILDGNRAEAVRLDSNFEEDWGDCLYLQPVLISDEKKDHTVEIEITEASDRDVSLFYLLSFIVS